MRIFLSSILISLCLLTTSVSHAEWKIARFPSATGDVQSKCILKGYSQNSDSVDLNVRQLALLLRRAPDAAKAIESAYGVSDAKLFLLEQALSGGEEDKCQPDFLMPVVLANQPSCAQLAKLLNANEIPFERRKFNLEFNSGKMTQSAGSQSVVPKPAGARD